MTNPRPRAVVAPDDGGRGGGRLTHHLRLVDESTSTRRGKPAGVLGVEIWNKVGTTPPTGERGPWSEQAQATIAA